MGKRILVTAPLGVGGISSMITNVQKNLDRDQLNFDYLVLHDRHEDLEDIVTEMGSRKIVASADDEPNKLLRLFKRWHRLYRVFKDNRIQILHLNGGPASDMTMVFLAKLAGVKHVTFHTHNASKSVYRNKSSILLSILFKPLMPLLIDDFWACSSLAAEFSFPKKISTRKKYTFIPNGIDLERFSFRPQVREAIRKTLGIADNFVVGHAGRFNKQKNHIYLIDTFHELKKVCPDAVLLLFGTGELMESVQAHVEKLGLTESVRFMGATDRLEDMYQAMDVFVMPSLGEGLPVAGVEAQASGLPTILSDTITREVGITDCAKYLPLSQDKGQWVDTILSYRGFARRSHCEELREAGFDEKEVAKYFQKYYLELDVE